MEVLSRKRLISDILPCFYGGEQGQVLSRCRRPPLIVVPSHKQENEEAEEATSEEETEGASDVAYHACKEHRLHRKEAQYISKNSSIIPQQF